jgi:hypothetical protein
MALIPMAHPQSILANRKRSNQWPEGSALIGASRAGGATQIPQSLRGSARSFLWPAARAIRGWRFRGNRQPDWLRPRRRDQSDRASAGRFDHHRLAARAQRRRLQDPGCRDRRRQHGVGPALRDRGVHSARRRTAQNAALADPSGNRGMSPAISLRVAALQVLQHGRSAADDVIRDLAELGCRDVDAPGRAKKASVIERSSDGDDLQKPA